METTTVQRKMTADDKKELKHLQYVIEKCFVEKHKENFLIVRRARDDIVQNGVVKKETLELSKRKEDTNEVNFAKLEIARAVAEELSKVNLDELHMKKLMNDRVCAYIVKGVREMILYGNVTREDAENALSKIDPEFIKKATKLAEKEGWRRTQTDSEWARDNRALYYAGIALGNLARFGEWSYSGDATLFVDAVNSGKVHAAVNERGGNF